MELARTSISENEAASQQAGEITQALMKWHPCYSKRRELEEASVIASRIDALYPLDIDFFITCLNAYLDSGRRLQLLIAGDEQLADHRDFAAWATFSEFDRNEALRIWGGSADVELEAALIRRLKEASPYQSLGEKKHFDACVNTLRLLARLFWYQSHLSQSSNPYRAHYALVSTYRVAMPDLAG